MAERDRSSSRGSDSIRKARLAEQLRANLQRRKAQSRSRRAGEPDERAEGLGGRMSENGPANAK